MKRQPEEFKIGVESVYAEARKHSELLQKLLQELAELKQETTAVGKEMRLTRYALLQVAFSKAKETELKQNEVKQTEVKEIDKEIVRLLSNRNMTFTELLNELEVSTATLTKYLDDLVAEGKIDRTEVGRNVVYQKKVTE